MRILVTNVRADRAIRYLPQSVPGNSSRFLLTSALAGFVFGCSTASTVMRGGLAASAD